MRRVLLAFLLVLPLFVLGTASGASAKGRGLTPPVVHLTRHAAGKKPAATPPGSPAPGDILNATTGNWSGSPVSFAYQWQDCDSSVVTCSSAAGTPSNTFRYVIASGDTGFRIRVGVTATYSGGQTATQFSIATTVVSSGSGFAFDDEFSGSSVDTTQWSVLDNTAGNDNGTFQCDHAANVTETGGNLVETATTGTNTCLGQSGGTGGISCPVGTTPVTCTATLADGETSARDFAFKYGTVVWNGEAQGGGGTWPAFWLLGSNCQHPAYLVAGADPPTCNWHSVGSEEVDVAEWPTGVRTTTSQTVFAAGGVFGPCTPSITDASTHFHVYELDWTASSMVWKIDGTTTCTAPGADVPSSLLFPIIQSAFANTTPATQTLTNVDYVRVTANGPSASVPPSISGSAVQGNVLTAATGTWAGSPTFTYQWYRCNSSGIFCSPITGATSSTYTLVSGDVGSKDQVNVVGTNGSGATQYGSAVTSTITAPSGPVPQNLAWPGIDDSTSGGRFQVGDTVGLNTVASTGGVNLGGNGYWSNTPTSFSYQWQICVGGKGTNCRNATGATTTSSSYTIASGDAGFGLRLQVTANNSGGSSVPVQTPMSPLVTGGTTAVNTALPVLSGTVQNAQTLTATTGTWAQNGSAISNFTVTFQDCNSSGQGCATAGGTGAVCNTSGAPCTYVVQSSDYLSNGAGTSTMKVGVTATNTSGTSSAVSSTGSVLIQNSGAAVPVNQALPVISGYTTPWSELMANNTGTWTNTPTSFTWQWKDCNLAGTSCQNATNTQGRPGVSLTGDPCGPTKFCYVASAAETTGSGIAACGGSACTIQVVVTATNASGSVAATTPLVGPVANYEPVECPNVAHGALTQLAGDALSPTWQTPNETTCWGQSTGMFGATGCTKAQIEAQSPLMCGTTYFSKNTTEQTLSGNNSLIANEWNSGGCITVGGNINNPTIRDVLLDSGDTCSSPNGSTAASIINTGQGTGIATNTLVEDTTAGNPIFCTTDSCAGSNEGVTVNEGQAIRMNMFGFRQPLISNTGSSSIQMYWFDAFAHGYVGCSHDDGTWFDSGTFVSFEHSGNWMGDPTPGGCTTGSLAGGADGGPQTFVFFDNSYGYGADGEATHAGLGSTFSAYTNNALSAQTVKGSGSGFNANDTGNTWAGNYSETNSTGAGAPFSTSIPWPGA